MTPKKVVRYALREHLPLSFSEHNLKSAQEQSLSSFSFFFFLLSLSFDTYLLLLLLFFYFFFVFFFIGLSCQLVRVELANHQGWTGKMRTTAWTLVSGNCRRSTTAKTGSWVFLKWRSGKGKGMTWYPTVLVPLDPP